MPFERQPLEQLAADGQLMAYRHEHFWQSMDTLRDKRLLESLWESGQAPWRSWDVLKPIAESESHEQLAGELAI